MLCTEPSEGQAGVTLTKWATCLPHNATQGRFPLTQDLLWSWLPLSLGGLQLSTACRCLPDICLRRPCHQADGLSPMQAPPLMTLTAAELIQGMCYAAKVTGVDTPENYNSVIASFPSKVKAAAIGFVRSRLNMPRAKDTDYIDNLCSKLAVTISRPILSLACCW